MLLGVLGVWDVNEKMLDCVLGKGEVLFVKEGLPNFLFLLD